MRIIFAGTPEFAVPPLLALVNSAEHDVVAVFTQPDRVSGRGKKLTPPAVKSAALKHQLTILQPESLSAQESVIEALQPDVMVVVAYGMILPQPILDIPKYGCINVHASILPRWRGAAPIQRAIEAGDQFTGVSIMQMQAGLDTGPVYQILNTEIGAQDTSADLHDRLSVLGATGLIDTLEQIHSQLPTKQVDASSSYAKKICKAEAIVDWQESASTIQRRIRAYIPWPVCQTRHGNTRIRLWQSSDVSAEFASQNLSSCADGEIISLSSQGVDVTCGDGVLRLSQLQRDGGKALTNIEFCNGYSLAVGDRFG